MSTVCPCLFYYLRISTRLARSWFPQNNGSFARTVPFFLAGRYECDIYVRLFYLHE